MRRGGQRWRRGVTNGDQQINRRGDAASATDSHRECQLFTGKRSHRWRPARRRDVGDMEWCAVQSPPAAQAGRGGRGREASLWWRGRRGATVVGRALDG
ncbi:hypothetical protein E2562_027927 [Oryza meyeriana var. granulata]|uniref:Uncharacterized protein n=1 Tax=Oryza meyeriana var. granulata TaxID=110450 RepID=A0A6G1EZM4_9ORYZ|nr:hypothetical protein E2562_027927 [Oryza meyeriana var. granulata]